MGKISSQSCCQGFKKRVKDLRHLCRIADDELTTFLTDVEILMNHPDPTQQS